MRCIRCRTQYYYKERKETMLHLNSSLILKENTKILSFDFLQQRKKMTVRGTMVRSEL